MTTTLIGITVAAIVIYAIWLIYEAITAPTVDEKTGIIEDENNKTNI